MTEGTKCLSNLQLAQLKNKKNCESKFTKNDAGILKKFRVIFSQKCREKSLNTDSQHHFLFLIASFLLFLIPLLSFAVTVESESQREAIVSPRTKKFYKSSSAKQYLSLGANYASDHDSKDYELTSRYFYQSQNFIHEINFTNENKYSNLGTAEGKNHLVKDSELYDFSLASKARISDTKNYAVFYHRTIYDDLSKYYYDQRTAVGLGRMFFNDKIEFDTSIGYRDAKKYGYKMDVVPSLRVNFKLTDKITFNQRGYWFLDHESIDNELKTSLIYRLGSKLSFEIRYTFEQRRYEDDSNKKREVENQVNKNVTIGLVFDLE